MIKPTLDQIQKAVLMGWQYNGSGLFTRGQEKGYFTENGFFKE